MEISGSLVNNEILSTIVIAFLYCYILHLIVKTIANSLVELIDYLYKKNKLKKQK